MYTFAKERINNQERTKIITQALILKVNNFDVGCILFQPETAVTKLDVTSFHETWRPQSSNFFYFYLPNGKTIIRSH